MDLSMYSSKLGSLYNYITNLITQDPAARIIVFLQYSDLVNFMVETFNELKINFVRVFGTVHQRHGAITKFRESKDCRLMMMSSESSVSGINSTEATYVILFRPFWTGKVEDRSCL